TTLYPFFTDAKEVKGTILVLHGMAEHHNRYREFTVFLNENGFDVYLYDHRGHGTDKKLEELGYISDTRGWEKLILDAVDVLSYLSEQKRGECLILFGHSMGSLVARGATEYSDLVDAAIFCGSTAPSRTDSIAGLFATSLICLFKGKRHPSPWLNQALFGRKRYTALSERTANDWLTRSQSAVGLYMNDPYCGFICTAGFYRDLVKLGTYVTKPANIRDTPKDLPILLLSGDKDPVSKYGDEIIYLLDTYKKLGYNNTDCILYENCRHELLNELNKKEIMEDILQFLLKIRNAKK
ncbi:MAG: lysophospholipase, partial [Lachnospiraceae bacterium]|nr:lysophospholipase [Lachnospiraceae bacterium]